MDDVLCLGWIDNNAVIALRTVHTVDQVDDLVVRLRRRPPLTSTNASNARVPFERNSRAYLPIPKFIYDYNHSMNSVDIADQLREGYETQKNTRRNWWPIFYFILDHACINSFLVGKEKGTWGTRKKIHLEFRMQLYQQLFEFDTQGKEMRKKVMSLGTRRFDAVLHTSVLLSSKRRTSAWCSWIHKENRKFGEDITNNLHSKRPDCTLWGCAHCAIPLCEKNTCSESFHNAN